MKTQQSFPASALQPAPKLIMVLEPNEEIGARLVRLIRRTTPFQAMLSTNQASAHSLREHSFYFLANDTFR